MFIELNENNEITASAKFKFSDRAIETDKEIVFIDGKNYFKDEAPDPLIIEKKRTILEAKRKLEDLFYSQYPPHRQNNIALFGTEEQKSQFKTFHDEEVKKFDEFETKVNGCQTVGELEGLKMEN
jgi:hypothetical protein